MERGGYVTPHPAGYELEADQARHASWLKTLGYSEPLNSLFGSEPQAQFWDMPLKWKVGRSGIAPEHGYDAFVAHRAMRFLEENREKHFSCFVQFRGPHDPYAAPRPYDTMFPPERFSLPPYSSGEFANKPKRQREAFHSPDGSRTVPVRVARSL